MRHGAVWLIGAALAGSAACGDGGGGPSGDEGARLAAGFERLADSVDGAGWSPTADALRHAAEIVRLTGHATPVTLTIDGTARGFLAVAEQLDFPRIVCSWPSDTGTVTPDGGGGGGTAPPGAPDPGDPATEPPPEPPPQGECEEDGTYSMRTLIAWEPEHMAEVVRLVADPGAGEVSAEVPDVMTGLPTAPAPGPDGDPAPAPEPGGTGGGVGTGYPGFMGEYLVDEAGMWFAVEGSQTNALESSGGACTADGATFDWADFRCEAARFAYEFSMRVESVGAVRPPLPDPEDPGPEPEPQPPHTIAMARTAVDGVRLEVVAWAPPPGPVPGPEPLPPDSAVATSP